MYGRKKLISCVNNEQLNIDKIPAWFKTYTTLEYKVLLEKLKLDQLQSSQWY